MLKNIFSSVFTVETKNATEAIKRFLGDDGAAGENK